MRQKYVLGLGKRLNSELGMTLDQAQGLWKGIEQGQTLGMRLKQGLGLGMRLKWGLGLVID